MTKEILPTTNDTGDEGKKVIPNPQQYALLEWLTDNEHNRADIECVEDDVIFIALTGTMLIRATDLAEMAQRNWIEYEGDNEAISIQMLNDGGVAMVNASYVYNPVPLAAFEEMEKENAALKIEKCSLLIRAEDAEQYRDLGIALIEDVETFLNEAGVEGEGIDGIDERVSMLIADRDSFRSRAEAAEAKAIELAKAFSIATSELVDWTGWAESRNEKNAIANDYLFELGILERHPEKPYYRFKDKNRDKD